MDDFNFLCENPIFEKNTKAIVHGFVKKMGFSDRNWNRTVLCQNVRIYVLKLFSKNE